jgi:hypothetical protein
MKTFLKTIGITVGCLVVLLVVFRITGFGPHGRTPGLWLDGELVTTPVTDWSFTDTIQNVQLQTNTWYGVPHSVNINCVSYKGQLYLDSFYAAGLTYPHGRSWNENVARDPHVRIRVGNKLYDRTLVVVTDPALHEAVDEVKLKKYPTLKLPPGGTIVLFHVVDNT